MRFGGHETFTIREGWLTKAMRLLADDPAKLVEEFAEDHLGVGRNMVKSIRHWIVATGIASTSGAVRGKTPSYDLTPLGQLLVDADPYLLDPGSWWFIHINLVNCPDHAVTWGWFFNVFASPRFERAVCIEALDRHLRLSQKRTPSRRTLERDVACLLASYSTTIPRQRVDPEDAADCPLGELGLMSHFRSSNQYQINRGEKPLRPEVVGYAIASSLSDAEGDNGRAEIPLQTATKHPGGPGRCFQMTAEDLFHVIDGFAELDEAPGIGLIGLAGERVITIDRRPRLSWIEEYYAHAAVQR